MLFIIQIALLVLWFTLLPMLAWWIVFMPTLLGATWICYRLASLVVTILHDYRNDTHTPFFK
jgi:hypothetical protein